MNGRNLLDAVGAIDDRFVEKAYDANKKPRRRRWIVPAAAALALAAGLGAFFGLRQGPEQKPEAAKIDLLFSGGGFDERIVASYKRNIGEKIDSTELVYDYHVPDDVIGIIQVPLFNHDGRWYLMEFKWLDAEKYVGEKVAHIQEKFERERTGYGDDTGNVGGDVFEVKGFDPEFMLCMRDPYYSDEVNVFICDNGYSVAYGADVLEDLLHASELLTDLRYENYESFFNGYREVYSLDPDEPAVKKFMKALDESVWCVPYETAEECDELWATKSRVITLMLDDIPLEVTLFDDVYARITTCYDGYFLKLGLEGIAPLLELMDDSSGTPVESTDESRAFRLEDAKVQPVFGKYVPEYVPENLDFDFCMFNYEVDHKTGEKLSTTYMRLSYQQNDYSEYVTMVFMGPEERDEWIYEDDSGETIDNGVHIDDLSVDSFRIIEETPGTLLYKVCVYNGDVCLKVNVDNVEMEQVVRMIRSCFDAR